MTSPAGNPLGEYLQARRGQVDPATTGLPAGGGARRVPGLRREEVAVLAGVSVDYYRRLEQGRERNPSTGVLEALARCLGLEGEAHTHLFRLAGVQAPRRRSRRNLPVSPDLLQLMDSWPDNPTLVIDRTLDVLAANPLAVELYSPFGELDNLARMTFLDPAAGGFFTTWAHARESTVANLRVAHGTDPDDARLHELVTELSASREFTELWGRQDVRGKTRAAKGFLHPAVGELFLTYQSFDVRGAPGQELVVYSAEPGSDSAQALRLLGTLAADRGRPGVSPSGRPVPG